MNFKEEVMFYLNNKNKLNNCVYNEEDEEEMEEASCKTKCSVCGKKKCTCDTEDASVSTKTYGADDDDDGDRAAIDTEDKEEWLKKIKAGKKKGAAPEDFHRRDGLSGDTTPEEDEMLKMFSKKKSSVDALPGKFGKVTRNKENEEDSPDLPDDNANGRNGSCRTKPIKESFFRY